MPLDKNRGGHRPMGADLTKIAQKVGWKYKTTIIWNEGNISRRTAWGSWKSASAPVVIAPVELIAVFYKDDWKKTNGSKISDVTGDEFKEWTKGVWTFNGESKKRIGHPAPFPKELPYRCIKLFSYQEDLVFDPFSGSGTTLLVAQNLNRKAVGVEIDETYCKLAKNRIFSEVGTLNFENGQTLCAQHNFIKKNFKQTETGKKMFIRLYDLAKSQNNEELMKFCSEILEVFEKNNVNGHIEWKK